MLRGQLHDRIHLATDTSIVNDDNSFGSRCNELLQFCLIQIQSVRSYIDKDRPGAAQNESINGGDERERWHDHFVPA